MSTIVVSNGAICSCSGCQDIRRYMICLYLWIASFRAKMSDLVFVLHSN